MTIPACVDDLTPEWFTEILEARQERGGARRPFRDHRPGSRRTDASSDVPDSCSSNCSRSCRKQRKFLRQIGLGVAEARLYAEVGNELPVRVPRVWHSDY